MTSKEYILKSSEYCKNPKRVIINRLAYLGLALTEESGEVVGIIKKSFRNKDGRLTTLKRSDIIREIGDVVNIIYRMVEELDTTIEEVHEIHLAKLKNKGNPF